jgi:hypothetical protein
MNVWCKCREPGARSQLIGVKRRMEDSINRAGAIHTHVYSNLIFTLYQYLSYCIYGEGVRYMENSVVKF